MEALDKVRARVAELEKGLAATEAKIFRAAPKGARGSRALPPTWVAVKELNLSYYIGETLLFTINTHYGNLI